MHDVGNTDQIGGSPPSASLEVLDLFAGIGGLSLGFREAGFTVTGVDLEQMAGATFELNELGRYVLKNLKTEMVDVSVPIVIGGPPCRPWSIVNLQKRGVAHEDHVLLERFFDHLLHIQPQVFLMENVPPIVGDPDYTRLVNRMRADGYGVTSEVIRYSHFGAATTRRRLFTVGFRNSEPEIAKEFFNRLRRRHIPQATTVHGAIAWLKNRPKGSFPDHHWSDVRTIEKYAERYRTGQFGWKKLDWKAPAPSFGSIAKTYILHPSSGDDDFPARVLSVREVLAIMGFPETFRFPVGAALHSRYRMVANSVSPIVATQCALVIKEMIGATRPIDTAEVTELASR